MALVVVLALHFLFLSTLWIREPIARPVTHGDQSSVLFFIEPPRRQVTPPSPVEPRATRTAPTIIAEPVDAPELRSSEPTSPEPPQKIDWAAQAADAAASVVDKAIREETRKCDPSDAPKSFLPPCNPRTRKFEWNPEPGRFGFSGGLPFVRVGERCAIGLGFFACGFGAKPPANGDLFEGMDDPERDRSSVPPSNP